MTDILLNEDIQENEISYTINDLPDELIEFILTFVPPYNDLHNCMQVCKRWRKSVLNVVSIKRRQLVNALSTFRIQWNIRESSDLLAKRYSHSAVVHGNCMYIFGGCTNSMTTFNDLWCLDLSTRRWRRPVASGIYPTPKACSSFACYGDIIILFGGWAYPCSYPFHQSFQLFNELHTYDILNNKWSYIIPDVDDVHPPPIAGHSVSIHGNNMVIFGGLQRIDSSGPLFKSNSVWTLDLITLKWREIETTSPKPKERYGHNQTAIDEHNTLIMGGCSGPNGLFNDVWLLNMKNQQRWTWIKVEVRNLSNAPLDSWCHPICHVGNYIVMLNKSRLTGSKSYWRPPGPGIREMHPFMPEAHQIRPPRVSPPEQVMRKNLFNPPNLRQKQMEYIRKQAARDDVARKNTLAPTRSKERLTLYLLDISEVLSSTPHVKWLTPKSTGNSGPEETLLYSLVHGNAELIMFGGIKRNTNNNIPFLCDTNNYNLTTTKVSNTLYFINAPIDTI